MAARGRKRNGGHHTLAPYKTYFFRAREQDPVIDQLRTIKDDEGMSDAEISRKSGVSTGTLGNWWRGKTHRPQNASIEATGRAMGKKRVWVGLR